VVASSSASLYDRVIDERFRDRLYYRLNMVHIVVPAGGDQEGLAAGGV
jgi:DNA-binding NtrC family response regulator